MRYLGRYRLDSVQGVGAFATVWRGWDSELDAPVAIKVLADNWSHHADVRERFLTEARLLRKIDDPRVVRVHDVGVEDGRPYFVMDYLTGGTVAAAVGRADPEYAILAAVESARAVQALHDYGVLHRDVKPANLLIHDGRVIVSDLGSAKRLAEASGVTVTTGTPAYMAPEQAYGEALDARCDVYSLGVLAYELLTGRLPFETPLGRGKDDRPPSVGLGPALDRVLSEAMASRAAHRTTSAAALADALATVAISQPKKPWPRFVVPATVAVGMAAAGGGAYALTTYLMR